MAISTAWTASQVTIGPVNQTLITGESLLLSASGGLPGYTYTATKGEISSVGLFTAP